MCTHSADGSSGWQPPGRPSLWTQFLPSALPNPAMFIVGICEMYPKMAFFLSAFYVEKCTVSFQTKEVMLLCVTMLLLIRMLIQIPATQLLIQLLANVSGEAAEEGAHTWLPITIWQVLIVSGCWFLLGTDLALWCIWRINQQMEDLPLSLFLPTLFFLCHFTYQVNK